MESFTDATSGVLSEDVDIPALDAPSNASPAIVAALIGLGAVSVAVLDRPLTVTACDSTG